MQEAKKELLPLPSSLMQIDTPNDGNCLFWSAALGLLLPTVPDEKEFTTMYLRLFGEAGSLQLTRSRGVPETVPINAPATIQGVRAMLISYDCQKNTPTAFQGQVLEVLVCEVFRLRVVNTMSTVFDADQRSAIALESGRSKPALASDEKVGDWDAYTHAMTQAGGWGGEPEIRAIAHLAGVNITVHGSGTGYPKHYLFTGASHTLNLAHVNADGKSGSAAKNHYHYILSTTVYQIHLKNCWGETDLEVKEKKAVISPPIRAIASNPPAPTSVQAAPSVEPFTPTKEAKVNLDQEEDKPVSPVPLTPASSSVTPVVDTKTQPLRTSVQFPALRYALQANYRQKSHLKLPLSEKNFPIKDVSLTISDKSEQDQQEKARRLAEEKAQQAEKKQRENKVDRGDKEEKEDKGDKEKRGGKKSQKDEFWSSRFRLEEEWHRVSQPIAVKDLFKVEKSTTPTRRILVEGRAGVGKTTFSQYVAHQWAQQNLFTDQFDYVFWIPLRECLAYDSGRSSPSMINHLAAFIYEKRLSLSERQSSFSEAIKTVLSRGADSRTLLILDGFDEVAHHVSNSSQPFYTAFKDLLEFRNVIVTTRDYQTPPSDIKFDRRLVNIGFTDAQISAYIISYCAFLAEEKPAKLENSQEAKSSAKEKTEEALKGFVVETSTALPVSSVIQHSQELETALKQNPRFWGLAHIPLNLALICESWSTLARRTASSTKEAINTEFSWNLVQLYQNVLVNFLKRDLVKKGLSAVRETLDSLSESYALELLSLGAIAWQAMQTQQLILSATPLNKALALILSDYPEDGKKTELTEAFEQALNLGLLRYDVSDEATLLLERRYYFIHLTFQEYFAAYYVLQSLQGRQGERAYRQICQWLAQHKYEPRYAVLCGFIAGLTTQRGYDTALQAFWHVLLSPPLEVVGAMHLRLVMRCLQEASFDQRILGRASLLAELRQWLDGLMIAEFKAIRFRQTDKEFIKPATDWFWSWLSPQVLAQSGWKVPPEVLRGAADKDSDVRAAALRALSRLGKRLVTVPGALEIVLKGVEDRQKDWTGYESSVRVVALEALGQLGEQLVTVPGALEAVLRGMADEEWTVQSAALEALGQLGKQLATIPGALKAVLKGVEDGGWTVQRALGQLGEQLATVPGVLEAVLKGVKKENRGGYKPARRTALGTLGELREQLATAPGASETLLKGVEDKSDSVREAEQKALGQLGKQLLVILPGALKVVLKGAADESKYVRKAAQETLDQWGEQLATVPEVLEAVLKGAADKEWTVQEVAQRTLGQLGEQLATVPEVLEAVLKGTVDENYLVRVAALKALGNLRERLAIVPGALEAVLEGTTDQYSSDVRAAAQGALGQLREKLATVPGALEAVLKGVTDGNSHVQAAVQGTLSQLGEQLAIVPRALEAVLKGAVNKDSDVRKVAQAALVQLGKQLATVPGALEVVLKGATDKDRNVRAAVLVALVQLGEQLRIVPGVLEVVLKGVADKDRKVRAAVLEALIQLGEQLPTIPGALERVLEVTADEDIKVRVAALGALCQWREQLATMPEALEVVLEEGIVDEDREDVRAAALKLLNAMDMIVLVKAYLKAETRRPRKLLWVDNAWQNPYLPILLFWIRTEWSGIALDNKALYVISGSRSERLEVDSPELVHPLTNEIKKERARYGLPQVLFQACVGKKAAYPRVKKPEFKATAKLSLSEGMTRRATVARWSISVVKKEEKTSLVRLDTCGKITLDFTVDYGDLTFGKPLGKGAAGEVYQGKYNLETVAIKRFLLKDFSPEKQLEIRTEASVMASIHSNHLVRLRGICLEKPHYCVVMEYLPQGDLYGLLKDKSKPLSWLQCYRLAADIAIGLYQLHDHAPSILHRDLKSLNVLLYEFNGEMRAKVSDFGLAVLKQQVAPESKEFAGTLLWSDPEILRQTGQYSKETDIYSLGLVLYELVSRELPYAHVKGSMKDIQACILAGILPLLPEECPSAFADLIRECWSKNPKDRPSARVLVERLEALYQAEIGVTMSMGIEQTLSGGSPPVAPKRSSPLPLHTIERGVNSGVPLLLPLNDTDQSTAPQLDSRVPLQLVPPDERYVGEIYSGVPLAELPPTSPPLLPTTPSTTRQSENKPAILPSLHSIECGVNSGVPLLPPIDDQDQSTAPQLDSGVPLSLAPPEERYVGEIYSGVPLAELPAISPPLLPTTASTTRQAENKPAILPSSPGITLWSKETPQSWLQPEMKLKPGEGVICLAQPKTSGGVTQLYVETCYALGKRKVYAYTLTMEEGAFAYEEKEIRNSESLSTVKATHTLSAHVMTESQKKALQSYLAEQRDQSLDLKLCLESGAVDWPAWYRALLTTTGVQSSSPTMVV